MTKSEILHAAEQCVCGGRDMDYGQPEDSFGTIAEFWSTYLHADIIPKDVAVMMALLKIARIKAGGWSDCFIDGAGYLACGGEIWTE